MGQALRRSTGRIRSSSLEPTPSSSSSQIKSVERLPPQAVPIEQKEISRSDEVVTDDRDSEGVSGINTDNVLEDRDPGYDAMLSQMVGRIRSKPGGKLEMGEAFVVEKYNRPMPKLRNTTPESGRYEEKAVPPGTLNVTQIRHILQLHHGKAEDHDGPMDVNQIAEKFRLDAAQLHRILEFLSLPPEDSNSNSKQKGDQ
ncbi:hypothetical protein BVC80_949g6 [Macleaya cordata]|uniref:Uncharacterized protein n=1 Tax=Macleaya cordata TaxID=56857 RepID=A0A200QX44_MACCD|nr:hypothetical protein BVC80_949g6 [Macleaya cordata]